jgi:hypothetical protein
MIDQDEPLLCFLTIEELMRTAHVVGEVPFVKPRHGMLLNLTTVQWIIEAEYAADEPELTTEEAVAALEDEQEGPFLTEIRRRMPGKEAHQSADDENEAHLGSRAGCRLCGVLRQ